MSRLTFRSPADRQPLALIAISLAVVPYLLFCATVAQAAVIDAFDSGHDHSNIKMASSPRSAMYNRPVSSIAISRGSSSSTPSMS